MTYRVLTRWPLYSGRAGRGPAYGNDKKAYDGGHEGDESGRFSGAARLFTTTLESPIWRGNVGTRDVREFLRSAIAHDKLQLALHDLQHALDAGLTECAQSP
jgi:hypothetical protein